MVGLSTLQYEETSFKEKQNKTFEYSKNPFTPTGRMNRTFYFIYSFIMKSIDKIADIFIPPDFYDNIIFCFLGLYLCICSIFIVKKRFLDITLNNNRSWVYAILLCTSAFILYYINPYCALIVAPFFIILLVSPAKDIHETYLGIPEVNKKKDMVIKEETEIKQKRKSPNIIKLRRKVNKFKQNFISNRKNILITLLCILTVFLFFRLTCFEQRIQGQKVITINKITGNATYRLIERY